MKSIIGIRRACRLLAGLALCLCVAGQAVADSVDIMPLEEPEPLRQHYTPSLEVIANGMKGMLPMQLGGGLEFTDFQYDPAAKNVVYLYTCSGDILNPQHIRRNLDNSKDAVITIVTSGELRDITKMIAAQGASVEIKFVFPDYNDEVVKVTLAPDEIRRGLGAKPMTDRERSQMVIANTVMNDKANLPMRIDEFTEWTDIYDDGTGVAYVYKVNVAGLGLGDIDGNAFGTVMREVMKPQLAQPLMRSLLEALIDLDKGLTFVYTDPEGTRFSTVRFTTEDLKAILRGSEF